MSKSRIKCPHCGKYDWDRAPRMFNVLDAIRMNGETTTRQISDKFNISISNASNQCRGLSDLGLIHGRRQPCEGGGVEYVYMMTTRGLHACWERQTWLLNVRGNLNVND